MMSTCVGQRPMPDLLCAPRAARTDDRTRWFVSAMVGSLGANHRLWQRTKSHGLPGWALVVVCAAVVLGMAGAAVVYVSSHSVLASSVMLGIGWLVATAVVSMADLGRR